MNHVILDSTNFHFAKKFLAFIDIYVLRDFGNEMESKSCWRLSISYITIMNKYASLVFFNLTTQNGVSRAFRLQSLETFQT